MHFGDADRIRACLKSRSAPDAQHDALRAAGCERIFLDTALGKLARRPELDKALRSANRAGYQLVVTKLDWLGRSQENLIDLSKRCRKAVCVRVMRRKPGSFTHTSYVTPDFASPPSRSPFDESDLRELILRWRGDTAGMYRTWFLGLRASRTSAPFAAGLSM